MKRLLQSSRFLCTLIGTVLSTFIYKFIGDGTFALAILGSFTAIVVTTTVKDTAKTMKGVEFKNGGKSSV